MISVNEAVQIIRSAVRQLSPVVMPLEQAAGLVLAADVFAPVDVPSFEQSAMDGYAIRFDDLASAKTLLVEGEVPAGVAREFADLQHKAIRIFTGAPVPAGADTVVMQEKVLVEEGTITVNDPDLTKGSNVRAKGAEIGRGDLGLPAGTYLSPAAVGFIAGIGICEVMVFPPPRISIIVTGRELQQPGRPLLPGQVYESNSYSLRAALRQHGILNVRVITADDHVGELQQKLEAALNESDMVLLTGGVSVGDYDFVLEAASMCGITKLFHKIKQRPGKPLFFGMRNGTPVFGLPGNPSSVLTCFYEYVTEALEQLAGIRAKPGAAYLEFGEAYSKKAGLTHFLKGRYTGNQVVPLNAQESFRLSSFATANCLIKLEEQATDFKVGDIVEVHKLR
ncbi:molybdopterin molybdotransferase MoeA [Segetibacter sp. 3557_3]|uniref:molybdopterin molybdotransferase MoeA n=1 Tax=Segetibacter sp. 3557_3 TaxID=2547429 RepID=UPI0010588D01|nr:gephyrin-like molybdotransferase Glp [Segetibacter sp. 3557_3]TDH21460.1 molybdopterin molybdotransferase MoeA [Segetibacter sp. 3557_3]